MRLGVVGCALAVVAIVACKDNPNIDGSKVPASDTTCPAVCDRLVKLCGYAPPDCTDDEAGGYCDVNLADDTILSCMATATSCQAAWDCPNVTVPADDGGDESTDDGATDDGGDDGATDDGASE